MAYVARKTDGKDTAKLVLYYYDPQTHEQLLPDDDDTPPTIGPPDHDETEAPCIKVWLRKFRGRDNRYMNDLQHKSDRKGTTHHRTGTVIREKVVRGVLAIEGMEREDGTPIVAISKTTYDDYLEQDFIDFCIVEINKHNHLIGEDEDDQDGEGGEVDLVQDLEG